MNTYIAVDLGASNGRIIAGNLSSMEVLRRFPTYSVKIHGSYYWDLQAIFREILEGLKEAFRRYGGNGPESRVISGIGIDTWGVDYVLTDKNGELIGLPYHYRDSRTDNAMEEVFSILPADTIYRETGIQFMQINTLFQLYSFKRDHPELFSAARFYLSIPDLLNYWLTGIMKNEYSHATTTQLFNPSIGSWSGTILAALDFPREMFGSIVPSGTKIGDLDSGVAAEVGAGYSVPVFAVGCHDTASAVAAVPAEEEKEFIYISSGTWSLLGIETPRPIINDDSYRFNFTNEGSVTGGIRFLKNIMGMWIFQECKKEWDTADGTENDYGDLVEKARRQGESKCTIDPADNRFLKPGEPDDPMTGRIRAYCREHCGCEPETRAELMMSIFQGLAEAYRNTIESVETITGTRFQDVHIIGGGSKNKLLSQLAADKTGRRVVTGPVEATALGNIMVQAIAAGEIDSVSAGRRQIMQSEEILEFQPR
ncbi:MAG: rhamnulokinase [Spirochaetales bacterium]|nr:rhamnulokinase [Spirochaetales bacterium]MCF7937408.1 rhamnulokinase [Spirochaetales bacterium]